MSISTAPLLIEPPEFAVEVGKKFARRGEGAQKIVNVPKQPDSV